MRACYLGASTTEREQIDSQVAAFLTGRFPGVDTVDLPYRTHCFRAALT